jgi:hypothetical protein
MLLHLTHISTHVIAYKLNKKQYLRTGYILCIYQYILTRNEGKWCDEDDLLAYGRQLMSFVDACPNIFNNLTQLKLENQRLGESDFHTIFSLSKRLEFLRLVNFDCGNYV